MFLAPRLASTVGQAPHQTKPSPDHQVSLERERALRLLGVSRMLSWDVCASPGCQELMQGCAAGLDPGPGTRRCSANRGCCGHRLVSPQEVSAPGDGLLHRPLTCLATTIGIRSPKGVLVSPLKHKLQTGVSRVSE